MSRAPRSATTGACDAVELRDTPRDADGRVDIDVLVDRVRRLGPVHVLASAPGSPGATRFTYVVPAPRVRLTADAAGLAAHGLPLSLPDDVFDAIDELSHAAGLTPSDPVPAGLPPFTGGLVGTFAYDLGRLVERVPTRARDDRGTPWLSLDLADVVVAIDTSTDRAWLVRRMMSGATGIVDDRGADLDARFAAVQRSLARPAPPRPAPRPSPQTLDSTLRTSLPATAYRDAVEQALHHIRDGDVFQVNLAQRITATWPGDIHDLYRALRDRSPAPHEAVIEGAVHVASISPETFLVADGRHVRTRPIKGTRPRGATPGEDRRLAAALEASPKDRAENVMIVDLGRNDLGRVCETGSVHVPRLLELEAHPTVWHLVSTIDGTLRPDVGWGGLLRATFPCGSITGTPKVRAMEVIDDLEPVRRGHYCGAIGWLGAGGARLSVAIRTATLHRDGTADYGAGGGIVADSDPAAEHAESATKALAFLDVVNGHLG